MNGAALSWVSTGSDYSKSALRWAAEEAKARDTELTVASVWTPLPSGRRTIRQHRLGSWPRSGTTTAILDDTVEEVLSVYSGLVLRSEVRGGNAARVLIDLSDGADVLIVGSRGHRGFLWNAPRFGKSACRGSC